MASTTLPGLLKQIRGKRPRAEMLSLLAAAGVVRSRMTLWAWENGKQVPPRDALHAYVKALGLPATDAQRLYEAAGLVVVLPAVGDAA